MAESTSAPRSEFAAPGANPTLESIELIRAILRTSDQPISRNAILRRLSDWNRATNRRSLNAALEFLGADGNVAEGSKGLIWVPQAPPQLADVIPRAKRL